MKQEVFTKLKEKIEPYLIKLIYIFNFIIEQILKINVHLSLKKTILELSFIQITLAILLLLLNNKLNVEYTKILIKYKVDFLNIVLGYDMISILFIVLTSFIFFISVLLNWNLKYKLKEYLILILILNTLLICIFLVLDLLIFYICFEAILMPMFLLIGIWGARERKIEAAYKFFMYTFFGSLFMLVGLFNLYSHYGTCDLIFLESSSMSLQRQILISICFLIAFSVKVPLFPFHLWLPEAHVEASTVGSVILAGVLLKLGTYGILRFVIFLLPEGTYYWTPLICVLSIIGVIYSACSCLRQVDIKKIIAYSSISHLNFCMLGLFSGTTLGLEGSLFLMLSHGIVSSGLFICVGIIYDRYKTRLLNYYSGLVHVMPLFSSIFFLFILSNLSFPGTSNFVGELLIFISLFMTNPFIGICVSFLIIITSIYSFWLFNRISFGKLALVQAFCDITKREFCVLLPLLFLNIILGVFSYVLSDFWLLKLKSYV